MVVLASSTQTAQMSVGVRAKSTRVSCWQRQTRFSDHGRADVFCCGLAHTEVNLYLFLLFCTCTVSFFRLTERRTLHVHNLLARGSHTLIAKDIDSTLNFGHKG